MFLFSFLLNSVLSFLHPFLLSLLRFFLNVMFSVLLSLVFPPNLFFCLCFSLIFFCFCNHYMSFFFVMFSHSYFSSPIPFLPFLSFVYISLISVYVAILLCSFPPIYTLSFFIFCFIFLPPAHSCFFYCHQGL